MVTCIIGSPVNKTAAIAEVSECWLDITLQGGGFVNPQSCLFNPHFSQTAYKYFPLVVKTTEGWVAMMPHLTRQPAPANIPAGQPWTASQEDYTEAELYSRKELVESRPDPLWP